VKVKRIIAGTLLATGIVSFGHNASAEDLWDIYQLALTNDAQYLAAAANYEAARLDLPLAKTQFRPSVTSNGTLGKQRSDFSGSNATSDNNQISLNLDLPLFDRAKRIQVDQAELQVANAELQFFIARDDLTLRVAERYFNLLAARDAKEVARLQKIAIKRQMDLAAERLDVGLGTRTDLFDARARFEQANADVIAVDILINNSRHDNIDHWIALATTNNLRVLSEGLNLQVASQEIDRQRAARHPTVNLGAAQRWNDGSASSGFDSDDSNTSAVGLTLNLPLYLGGSINLRTKQAGMLFNSSEQALEAAKRRAQSDTTSAFLSVTSGISQVLALEESIRAGESALEAKAEGFSAGLTTNLDVLDAQRDLSRSKTDYLRARYNYIIALLRLEQATGDLGDEDIQFINKWLKENNTAYHTGDQGEPLALVLNKAPAMLSFDKAVPVSN